MQAQYIRSKTGKQMLLVIFTHGYVLSIDFHDWQTEKPQRHRASFS